MARMSPAARRAAIIDAALAVMQCKGIAATTVRDVAQEMGTSPGLVHHYFDSMDELVATAFELAAGAGYETTKAAIAGAETPIDRLRAGTYIRYQSGAAWEARAQPSANVTSSSFYYLEPAGSRRMEDWLNVDLLTSYELRFGGVGVEVEARLNNVFDEQVELQVDNRYIINRPLVPGNPALSPSLDQPSNNPNFGRPTQISDPRALVLSTIVRF